MPSAARAARRGGSSWARGAPRSARDRVDRALVAVYLPQHQLKRPAHEPVHLLGVEALREPSEAGDVGEENRHLLALALERGALLEDALGQVRGGVALRRGEAGHDIG